MVCRNEAGFSSSRQRRSARRRRAAPDRRLLRSAGEPMRVRSRRSRSRRRPRHPRCRRVPTSRLPRLRGGDRQLDAHPPLGIQVSRHLYRRVGQRQSHSHGGCRPVRQQRDLDDDDGVGRCIDRPTDRVLGRVEGVGGEPTPRQPTPGRGRSRRAAWPWHPDLRPTRSRRLRRVRLRRAPSHRFHSRATGGAGPERPLANVWPGRLSLPRRARRARRLDHRRSWSRRSRRRSFLSAARPRRRARPPVGRRCRRPRSSATTVATSVPMPAAAGGELFGRRCGDVEFTVIGQRLGAFTCPCSPTMRHSHVADSGAHACRRGCASAPSSSPSAACRRPPPGSVPPTGTGCGGGRRRKILIVPPFRSRLDP